MRDLNKEKTLSQYELFKKYDKFDEHDYKYLAEYCKTIGIDFLSTPFDHDSVDFLEPMMPCIKVASADITNFPLLYKIGKKRKPVLLSTGASTLAEINMAIIQLQEAGCESIALLHCILNYPTEYENTHLNMIQGLIRVFPEHIIGYSDHSIPDDGMHILTTAYHKGARIIEKHFTYDKTLPGNDHYHAMDIYDLKYFKKKLDLIRKAEGNHNKKPIDTETAARMNARRSIVIKESITGGTILTEEMIICKRPASGISPIYWDQVVGKKTKKDLDEDHILKWSDLED